MIGIIILVDILLPPAVWKSVQCIFGILDLVPRITGYSAWLRILSGKNRRNGEIDIHISKILIEQFHAIIISLYTCGNLRIIPFVRFHRTVCHEVHLHILESCTVEQTGSLLHHSFHCRMRWIDCIGAVQFLRLSVGIEIDIFVFIFFLPCFGRGNYSVGFCIRFKSIAPIFKETQKDFRGFNLFTC